MSFTLNAPLWKLLEITDDNPEYYLYNSVIEEFTMISAWDIKYYVKEFSDEIDHLYGEDANAKYSRSFSTKLLYEPTEEQNLLDSFGISSDDLIQLTWIPMSVFERDVAEPYATENDTNVIIPKPGDCIRTLWNNKLYEIVDKGQEDKIFQGRKMIYEFALRPYRFSQEIDAENMVYDEIDEENFGGHNEPYETLELSGQGDNEKIQEESDNISEIDTSWYGYN